MPVSAEPGLVKRYSTPASFRVWRSSIPPVPVMVLRMGSPSLSRVVIGGSHYTPGAGGTHDAPHLAPPPRAPGAGSLLRCGPAGDRGAGGHHDVGRAHHARVAVARSRRDRGH